MPNKAGRSTEQEISLAVLKYLTTVPHGEATIEQIKYHLPNFMEFTEADMEVSGTRPNEMVWEQQVRNIVSHRKSPDSYINDGLMAYSPDHLAITDAGRTWLAKRS